MKIRDKLSPLVINQQMDSMALLQIKFLKDSNPDVSLPKVVTEKVPVRKEQSTQK